ncbi:MAG: MtN3 and saliva related transmembrane protein [Colwellia sp.]
MLEGIEMNWLDSLGLVAAVCTTFSFIPQVVMVYKSNNTSALSPTMYSVFTIGVFLWLLYGIVKQDTAIIIANFVTLLLGLSILFKIIIHRHES